MKLYSVFYCLLFLASTDGSIVPQPVQEVFSLEPSPDYNVVTDKLPTLNEVTNSFWPHLPYFLKPTVNSENLQASITLDKLNESAWELYNIANASIKKYGHPTRVIGSQGHFKTIHYILTELHKHSDYYDFSVQSFYALTGKVNSYELSYPDGKKIATATAFSLTPPVKGFVGEIVKVPNLGCDDADFDGLDISDKSIALVERGVCPFGTKSSMAGKHGFKAIIIYDNDPSSENGVNGTLERPDNYTIASIGISNKEGKKLISELESEKKPLTLYFEVDSYVKDVKTLNIIADTKHGDPENIVALGAHSDSVAEGPGINDDGSGAISLLTVAKELTNYKINNKVRFAWWSAEEEGLLGSTYYAEHLTEEENSKIRLFMDYDMMASPNYEYQIYDANNIDHPVGSEELKQLYVDFYSSKNLTYSFVPFDGRSDYVGFIDNGIPAGGIATGAEGINKKNGIAFDVCYHQLCDDVSNLAFDAFLINTQLIAHSVATYAKSLEDFPKRSIESTLSKDTFVRKGSYLVL